MNIRLLITAALSFSCSVLAADLADIKEQVVKSCARQGIELKLDLPYAGNTNPRQMVDLYLPAKRNSEKPLPVVVYIHGGGWKNGDRLQYTQIMQQFVLHGNYAAVGVGYRLVDEAKWPAQINDCKAAIRWIRGHAKEFGLDVEHIGVVGASAGGHLASLLGTSGDVEELEGSLGEFTSLSSRVACVVNQCGPQDFSKGLMVDQNGQPVLDHSPLLEGLFGGKLAEKMADLLAASPITYVSADDPPFLTIHGTADSIVHFSSHAKAIHTALQKAGVPSLLITILGGDHASPARSEPMKRAITFLDKHLQGADVQIDTSVIQVTP